MKIPRQGERWARFQVAFRNMPTFETWDTEDGKPSVTYEVVDGQAKLVELGTTRHHVRLIPRRVRRSMARDLAKRQLRAECGLPEKNE